MKVGIITFHNTDNYGEALQIWALQKVLQDYGLNAGIINYHPDKQNSQNPITETQGLKQLLSNVKYMFTRRECHTNYNEIYEMAEHIKLIGNYQSYQELKSAKLNLDAYIVTGSRVWAPELTGGIDPAYFLDFAEPGKIMLSYAAGFGDKDYTPEYVKDMGKKLKAFTGISVSEADLKENLQKLTGKPIAYSVDPLLLLTKQDYDLIKINRQMKSSYILVYLTGNNQKSALVNLISETLQLPVLKESRTKGLKNGLPSYEAASAGEFLGLVEGAAYIITDNFCGTALALLYEKPFLSITNPDFDNRTKDLLNTLGLQDHLFDGSERFQETSGFYKENTKKLREQLDTLRRISFEFLIRSLGLSDRYEKVQCPTGITKEQCYGCNACAEVCGAGAIRMIEDKEGFLYPVVDTDKCTKCNLCSKTCIRNASKAVGHEKPYPKAYCAYHTDDEIRKGSSSGGVFPELARYAIVEKSGAVIGVRYDEDMRAVSDIAYTMEDAKAFSGSKYVKSDFRGIFPKVRSLLKEGRFVLYSGLPCECAGLRAFLRKDYDNLLICELLCHSAPSPRAFEKYVQYLGRKNDSKVVNIRFRGKDKGWDHGDCETVITLVNGKILKERTADNIYYRNFVNGTLSRPSCSSCEYTFNHRAGDLTIGDCWGIKTAAPELYDNKGVNLIIANNKKAEEVLDKINSKLKLKRSTLKDVFQKNHKKPSRERRQRTAFFNELDNESIEVLLSEYTKK